MRARLIWLLAFLAAYAVLLLLHGPLLHLPYFWDEAGYYIPAALDFYHSGLLVPRSTLPVGHTPLVIVYLGLAWRLWEYSPLVTRAAMTLIAAATVVTLYLLGRRVASREVSAWSALLLALSPLFFAQSTLAHLDLTDALFTTLAVLLLLEDQLWLFALAASLAILSKETAVVLLPVVWLYVWRGKRVGARNHRAGLLTWVALGVPLVPLAAWALYYHHLTGYWTGNREYLNYNLYSTLSTARGFWSLLRRAYQLFIGGFNWLLTACALVGFWWGRKHSKPDAAQVAAGPLWRPFIFLTAELMAVYLLLLSFVGGAILPRYLLPVLPFFYLIGVALVMRLPRFPARLILAAAAACFVWAWFINPPCPFPFEDNLAYADFIRLHEQAAHFLETQPGQPRILTAWPATDELARPFLGYVGNSLHVVPLRGFAATDFAEVKPESFDLLYLYSQKWEPAGNWTSRFPEWLRVQLRYFDYHSQVAAQVLVAHYRLRLLVEMEHRGQWVRIYSQAGEPLPRPQ
jgi:4-amino-4-deoxy-L-arabinose transferase-like glycosyltransferase